MEHTKDCMRPIDMREFANALLAPQPVHPYVKENLNEACNRRAQLALTTVEAAIVCKLHYLEDRANYEGVMPDAKTVLEELKDDLNTIKRGFQNGNQV